MLKILPLAKVRFASHALLLLEAAWHRSEKNTKSTSVTKSNNIEVFQKHTKPGHLNKTYYTYCNLYRGKLEKSRIVEILKVRFSLFYFSFRARLVTSTPLAKPKPEDFCGTPCHCGHCDFQDEMCEVSRITGLPLNKKQRFKISNRLCQSLLTFILRCLRLDPRDECSTSNKRFARPLRAPQCTDSFTCMQGPNAQATYILKLALHAIGHHFMISQKISD